AAAPQAPAAPSAVATQVVESLLQLARIVNTAVEDWGETKEDDSLEVIFHKEEADKLEEILEFFDSLPDAPPEEGVILSGPSRAARVLRAMAAPAAPVVDAGDQVLGEWPRVSGVGRDAESPRTLLLYLQTEASDDELRAIHDALLDGGALATHALSELMHIGYRVEGGKLVPPENLSVRASEFFGVTAVAAKATAVHSDDVAVDRFAVEMKAKLAAARAKGRGGWETCPPEVLSRMLREHADKGDPRDVANFCMFLWSLGQPISVAAPAAPAEGEVLVEVIGLTGSGKSAICGEIEILCRALGLDVSWPDGDPEKNMTHAEWTAAIEAYKPRVRIVERNVPRQSNGGPAK
ncbi:hypothetical protein N7405_30365, partial [Delftia tsuruhatensis]|nr:hypothetical protein [Delftia tsuruhatensis]